MIKSTIELIHLQFDFNYGQDEGKQERLRLHHNINKT